VKKRGPKMGGLYDLDDLLIFLTVLTGWAHLQSPWSEGLGAPPEAESLFAFGRLIVQYFAVFIRFSGFLEIIV